MTRPYSIKIFMPAADPDGLRTIEKSNWSGCGLIIPRALLDEAKKRKEVGRTGVYLLTGPAEESGLPRIYVGEGDPIRPRLEQHAAKKDFWTHCIAFTSKDENLNKAHVQFLEARLVTLAAAGKRCIFENGNVPQLPSLSEADAADAEGFLSEMLMCLPLLGISLFNAPAAPASLKTDLNVRGKGIEARGTETPQGFLVRRGSGAAAHEVPSCHDYLRELRAALLANGVLRASGDRLEFTQDYVFSSPSTAAGVVLGRSANGRIEWKTPSGQSLKSTQSPEAGP
jgi:hypothetical protein